jgi:hypothetical protein
MYVVLGVAFVLALTSVRAGLSQSGAGMGGGQSSMGPPFTPRSGMGSLSTDTYDPVMMERRLKALNIERQKELVSDTNKLLKLARELNAEVAAQKGDTLTSEQLHKIIEIEKLARSVKERMTAGIGAPQPIFPQPGVVFPMR